MFQLSYIINKQKSIQFSSHNVLCVTHKINDSTNTANPTILHYNQPLFQQLLPVLGRISQRKLFESAEADLDAFPVIKRAVSE